MVIRRKSRNITLKTPLAICLLAAASSVVLAGVVVTLSTQPVQADARLPRPAIEAPPVAGSTPTALAPKQTIAEKRSDLMNGIASWYGSVLNGHRTASGERFDMYAMTACHPTLPFGTIVRVTDVESNRSVVVRINDRGVLSEGRIIDLSYAAAQQLKITKSGLAPVALDVLSLGRPHHRN
jgi:rare lipoprotein A